MANKLNRYWLNDGAWTDALEVIRGADMDLDVKGDEALPPIEMVIGPNVFDGEVRRLTQKEIDRENRNAITPIAAEAGDLQWNGRFRHATPGETLRALHPTHPSPILPAAGMRPEILALCGSTRFVDRMAVLGWLLEKGGAIVLGLHLLPPWYAGVADDHQAEAEGVKDHMDALHLRKIELADRVVVCDFEGYVGDSTRAEIEHAEKLGVPLVYLSSPNFEHFVAGMYEGGPMDAGLFVIWSGEHNAYWRPNASGYALSPANAGRFTRARAIELTRHCGPEKAIEIRSALKPREPGERVDYRNARTLARVDDADDVVDVVAAVRRSTSGRVWVARRDHKGRHGGLAGMWEYPGGRVEPGETLEAALAREMREEFDVEIEIGALLDVIESVSDDRRYRVHFYAVAFKSLPYHKVHTAARWVTPQEAVEMDHLPAGTVFNEKLAAGCYANLAVPMESVPQLLMRSEALAQADGDPGPSVESGPGLTVEEKPLAVGDGGVRRLDSRCVCRIEGGDHFATVWLVAYGSADGLGRELKRALDSGRTLPNDMMQSARLPDDELLTIQAGRVRTHGVSVEFVNWREAMRREGAAIGDDDRISAPAALWARMFPAGTVLAVGEKDAGLRPAAGGTRPTSPK